MITNRTRADVNNINLDDIVPKKGAYNYTDLNRVESKVAELNQWLKDTGYMTETLTTKTNWKMTDIFKQSDGTRYLNNVKKIRQAMAIYPSTPTLPSTMNKLTYTGANNIEKILVDKENQLYGTCNWYVYGGVANGGQPRLWQHRFRDFYHPTVSELVWNELAKSYDKWRDFSASDTWESVSSVVL